VTVADLNGDGKPDLVVGNCGSSTNNCNNLTVGVLMAKSVGERIHEPLLTSSCRAALNNRTELYVTPARRLFAVRLAGRGERCLHGPRTSSSNTTAPVLRSAWSEEAALVFSCSWRIRVAMIPNKWSYAIANVARRRT
jgi:hypothetical protein